LINQKSIDAFLARQLDNHDWLKGVSRDTLVAELELDHNPSSLKRLWHHQLVALTLLHTFRRFMLHLDMGGGKTLISLSFIESLKAKDPNHKALVFVPYVSAVDTWVQECAKHTPDLRLVGLTGTTAENIKKLEAGDGDVFVICYASCVAAFSVPNGRGRVRKRVLETRVFDKVCDKFATVVYDEIHKCSDTNTLTYRLCRRLSTRCTFALGLSGTPFGKDIEALWGQFYLIDFGETFGDTKGLFLESFFTKKLNYFSGFPEYNFNKKMLPTLKRCIKHNSIHYDASEMSDLPALRYIQRNIPLPSDIEGYVSISKARFQDSVAEQSRRLAEASYNELRQLASGFMTVAGADTKVKVSFDHNPKLDVLEEYIDAMPADSKMVVFHHFVYTNQLISDRLKKLKVGHARVWGGRRNAAAELERFRSDAACRILVINDQSGSSSLNLQHANYMLFFEQPDSAINRAQAEKRIYRAGQRKPVYIIDPFMAGTVDRQIFESCKRGRNLLQEVLKGSESI
jgi:SNF2 family DNA or RNA helicase